MLHTYLSVLLKKYNKLIFYRSVAGSYDNEGIAIFALMFTYYLWIKAVKTGSMYFGAWTAMAYFYMVSAWGGYVFIINLIPLHVLTLLLMATAAQVSIPVFRPTCQNNLDQPSTFTLTVTRKTSIIV